MILAWVADGIVEDSTGAAADIEAAAAVWDALMTAANESGFRVTGLIEILNAANELAAADD
jgi:hypothetical protein